MTVLSSVPGKAILFGEHAIVYPGNSAVVTSVRSVFSEVTSGDDPASDCAVAITNKNTGQTQVFQEEELRQHLAVAKSDYELFDNSSDMEHLRTYRDPANYVKLIMAIAVDYLRSEGIATRPTSLILHATMPEGGMGASAAVAASLIQAYASSHDVELDQDEWYRLSLKCEQYIHGRPSGVDIAAVIWNQPILVTKDDDGVNKITALGSAAIPLALMRHCYIIHSGNPKNSTGELVAYVRGQGDSKTIAAIEKTTKSFLLELSNGTLTEEHFMRLINQAGLGLERLGVVTRIGLDLSRMVRANGGAAKVSGAGGLGSGGSGAMLVYLRDPTLLTHLKRLYQILPLTAASGARV